MKDRRLIAVGLLTATLPFAAACSQTSEALGEASSHAARVVPLRGAAVSKVILSQPAYDRLGIQTQTVHGAPSGASGTKLVVPVAAVLYDAHGRAWTYTTEGRRTFVRAAVTVDHFEGGRAYLTDGPAAGTTIVTVGVPELFGAEQGVDGE